MVLEGLGPRFDGFGRRTWFFAFMSAVRNILTARFSLHTIADRSILVIEMAPSIGGVVATTLIKIIFRTFFFNLEEIIIIIISRRRPTVHRPALKPSKIADY